jgi:hypothetical protein
VPEISRFYGIVIEMWRNEDHRRPHFHAKYGRYAISMMIDDGSILGEFPPRKLKLLRKWWNLHRQELLDNWHLARMRQPPRYIEPLC